MGNVKARLAVPRDSTAVVLSQRKRECVALQGTELARAEMPVSLDGTQVREGSPHLGRRIVLRGAWQI